MHYKYENVELENRIAHLNDDVELDLKSKKLTDRDVEILGKRLKKNKVSHASSNNKSVKRKKGRT